MNQNELEQYNSALAHYGLTVDEFIKIRKSNEFFQLDAEMKRVSTRYLDIPTAIRETALVAVLAGKTKNMKNIYEKYYYRPILSFEDFISEKYLPKMSKSLFPTWKEGLTKFFDPNKAYYELVYSGAIGTGKSTSAMVAHAYNLSRITSLANPQEAMGVAYTTQMTLLLMSILKGKAVQVLLAPLVDILDDCPLFYHVDKWKQIEEIHHDMKGAVTPFYVGKETIYFPNNIFVQIGSEMRHAIGAGLFGASLDEAEFRRGASTESVYKLYYQMKERVRSRFIGLKYILLTLISSVQSETGMITSYIKTLPENSPHTMVFDYPIWTVRFPNAIRDDGYFYVMRGNVAHPSRVLTQTEAEAMDQGSFVVPNGCKVIQVPKRYEQEFNTNVSVALMNLAGMASAGDEKPFSDTSNIEDKKLSPELTFDINLEGPNDPVFSIGKVLEDAGVFTRRGDEWQLSRCPDSDCYMHLDLANTGIAGISMCHKELGPNNKVLYVFNFILRITTKTSISFESIRRFLTDLKMKYSCKIHTLTADQYQSTMIRQYCMTNRIAKNVAHLSVDRNAEQYYQLANAVTAGQVKAGTCPYLREQLDIIRITNNKPYAENNVRKDVADSVCLSYDTKLTLLSGRELTIEELYNSKTTDWILSCDTISKKIIPVEILDVVNNGIKEYLIEITLDNGKSFKVTPDHLILCRDGSYKEASRLQVGDSLMPFNIGKEFTHKDYYRTVTDPFTNKTEKVYRLVAREVKQKEVSASYARANKDGSTFAVIHHNDHNKYNDLPSNLIPLTNREHRLLHGGIFRVYNTSEEKRKRTSELNKQGISGFSSVPNLTELCKKNGKEQIIKYNKSEKHRERAKEVGKTTWVNMQKGITEESRRKAICTRQERYPDADRNRMISNNKNEEMKRKQKLGRIKKIYQKVLDNSTLFNHSNVTLNEYKLEVERLKKDGVINKNNSSSFLYEDLIEAGVPITNHQIVSIKLLKNTHNVYDLKLDKIHNFGIEAGVFVHNCGGVYNAICNSSDIPIHLYNEIDDEQVYNRISNELMKKFKIIN